MSLSHAYVRHVDDVSKYIRCYVEHKRLVRIVCLYRVVMLVLPWNASEFTNKLYLTTLIESMNLYAVCHEKQRNNSNLLSRECQLILSSMLSSILLNNKHVARVVVR